ncbi:MAG: hypothetical protein QM791_04735 [Ferruginibacter sp.]
MQKLYILPVFLLTGLFSCKKQYTGSDENCKETKGTIMDLRGKLDGCGFMITLADGTRLEPIQSPADFTFTDGGNVLFCYKTVLAPSVCMAGITVIIKSIRYIP